MQSVAHAGERAVCARRGHPSPLSLGPRHAAAPASSPSLPRFLSRLRRAAARGALGVLLLAGAGTVAVPASAAELVGNVGQSGHGAAQGIAEFDHAQGFTTGSNSGGYTLTDIQVEFGSGAKSGISVKLATGLPSSTTEVVTLSNPSLPNAGGARRFTAPSGTTLNADTEYWVVVEGTGGILRTTTSNSEDSGGLSGWEVADGLYRRDDDSTGEWTADNTTNLRIRVNGSVIVLTVSSAEVTEEAPKELVLTFSEALATDSVPAASAFAVKIDGSAGPDVSSVAIDGDDATKLKLGLAYMLTDADSNVTVDYTKPGSNPLKDGSNNEVATFTGREVTNNAPACPGGLPASAFWTACLTAGHLDATGTGYLKGLIGSLNPATVSHESDSYNVDGFSIVTSGLALSFESDIGTTVTAGWRVNVGSTEFALANATYDSGSGTFTWSSHSLSWSSGDKVSVSLQGADTTAPTVSAAEVTGAKPKELVLSFDEALATDSVPATSAFAVKIGGSAGPGVSSVAIDGDDATKLKLGLAYMLTDADSNITVDYTKPGSKPLKDAEDNEVATFTGQSVTNNAPACPGSQPADAFWTACLTVGDDAGVLSGFFGSNGSLSPATFTRKGTSYEIDGISESGGTLALSFTADPRPASESWMLQVGSLTYRLDAKDSYSTSRHTYVWNVAGFDWANSNVGDKVSVSLRATRIDLTLSKTEVDVDEGGTAEYTVQLAAQPGASVTVDIATDDAGAATVNPARLTFSTGNWDQAQTVTVTGVADADAGDERATLTHSGSGVLTATVEVRVDDDELGLVFSPASVDVDEGDTASYEVTLSRAPTANVTVAVTSGDTNAATVSPASLTFTTGNWNSAQQVTVTGVEDVDEDDETVTLTHTASGLVTGTIEAMVRDDEGAALFVFSQKKIEMREGGTATYTVRLRERATSITKVLMYTRKESDPVSEKPGILTFDEGNWDIPQEVTLKAGHDSDDTDERGIVWVHYLRTYSGHTEEDTTMRIDVVDDDRDCPNELRPGTFWEACLTIGSSGGKLGYFADSGTTHGNLSDTTVSFGGVSYTIEGLHLENGDVHLDLDGDAEAARATWVLTDVVMGADFNPTPEHPARITSFNAIGQDAYDPTTHTLSTELTRPDWQDGHRISVGLLGVEQLRLGLRTRLSGSRSNDPMGNSLDQRRSPRRSPESQEPQRCEVEVSVEFLDDDGNAVAVESLAASDFTVTNGSVGTPVASADGLRWTVPARATPRFRGLMRVQLPATEHWEADEQVFQVRSATECAPVARNALDALSLEGLDLDPAFETATRTYTAAAPSDTDMTTVTATAVYEASALTLAPGDADTETEGHQVALAAGETQVTVTVTPEDEDIAAESWTVTVTREAGAGVLTGFVLVDTSNDADVGTLTSEATVEVSADGTYGMRAETQANADIGSVVLSLSGAKTVSRTENLAPWSLYGDRADGEDRVLNGASLPAGSYTMTATAYAERAGAGAVLGTLTVPFTVEEETAPVTPPPAEVLTGFVLLDASDQSTVATLSNNAAIDLEGRSGGSFAIRADVAANATVGSVVFSLSGAKTVSATESVAPYSLYGDHDDGNGGRALDGATLPAGTYTLSATAYAEGGGAGEALGTRSVSFEVLAPALLSVADARAEEGTDATLDFAVTLDRSSTGTVTVEYATSDGTATAGDDYTATSGTLTFAPGDREKTIAVPVLDDANDEGEETMTLRLSNASGANIADGEATGTITNSDPIQKMWLARFGRTVGSQVVDAVAERLGSPLTSAQVTLGGQGVDLTRTEDGEALAQALVGVARIFGAANVEEDDAEERRPGAGAEWREAWGHARTGPETRSMSGRDVLLGSAFHFSRSAEDGGPGFAAWGRVTAGGFDAEEQHEKGAVDMDGEVTTGIVGADAAWERWLAGVAVSVSEGKGTYAYGDVGSGKLESTLTGVHPYARVEVNDRVQAWGLLGFGAGEMTMRPEGKDPIETDIDMRLGAVGAQGALTDAGETGGVDLVLKGDAFLVQMESARAPNTEATSADASRLRLALEGARTFALGQSAALTPGLEVGLRHDGGDAETGTGVELGGRIAYANAASGLSVEASARTLIAHEDSGYEEWGASGSVRLDTGASGRGLSFTLAPTLGAASSGVERLWSLRDARELANDGAFEAEGRLDAEVGYGLPVFGAFTGTPYAGLGLSESGRDVRLGWRLSPGGTALDFELGVEGAWAESTNDDAAPERGVMLQGTLRW